LGAALSLLRYGHLARSIVQLRTIKELGWCNQV
jgi:hypothetical protein